MKIDKSRFLLLTTSLAATAAAALVVSTSACNTTTTETDAGGNNTPGTDAGNNHNGDSSTADGSTKTDAGDAGDGAVACLGTDGTAPLCEEVDGGADSGAAAKCSFECTNVSKLLKAGVAAAISSCMDTTVADPTVEGACSNALAPCVEGAVAKACDDDTAAAYCTTTLQACGDASAVPTQAECVSVVKALSGEGKTMLTSCTAEGDCGSCFDNARTGTLF